MTERRQGWDRSADMPEIAVSMDHHGMGFKLLAVSRQKPSVDPCLVDELGKAKPHFPWHWQERQSLFVGGVALRSSTAASGGRVDN